jgi:hypothetical protein
VLRLESCATIGITESPRLRQNPFALQRTIREPTGA